MSGAPPTNDAPFVASADSDPIREKAIRLFRYLSALAELRAKNVRDVSSYEAVFWFSELPQEKECFTAAWGSSEATEDEHWLRIKKPVRPELPKPPAECEHWLPSASLEEISPEPKLCDEIVDPDWISSGARDGDEPDLTPAPRLLLSDRPDLALAWAKYLETKWRSWRA